MTIDVQSVVLAVLTLALGVLAFALTTAWVLPIMILVGGAVGLHSALRP